MQTSDAARGTYCALVRRKLPKAARWSLLSLTTMSRAGPRIRQRLFHAPARGTASRMLLHNSDPSAGWTTGGRLLHEPPNMLPAVAGLTLVVHHTHGRDPNREGANREHNHSATASY
uniref:Uncharacterized protein n=1 Tax=Globodera rostochiensis TaxID=31243 RepID=A0A914HLN8_GLORO